MSKMTSVTGKVYDSPLDLYTGDDRTYWERAYEAAKERDYPSPAPTTASESSADARAFLAKLAAEQLPHPPRGIRGIVDKEDGGNFLAHLQGCEDLMREWQRKDGKQLIPDTMCLAGLYHSIYGTQGYQAFRFPPERRDEIRQVVGARGEATCFYTCVMERGSWHKLVLANKDLKRGETPQGALRPRSYGSVVDVGYVTGDEQFHLSADEYTDMCATYLAHRLEHNEKNRRYGVPGKEEAVFEAMAKHVGGAALEEYRRTMAAIEAAEADGVEVHGGYTHVSAAAEPAFTELYADAISQQENVAEEMARL